MAKNSPHERIRGAAVQKTKFVFIYGEERNTRASFKFLESFSWMKRLKLTDESVRQRLL